MFTGLSAFPLTPMNEIAIDEKAFVRLVNRLTSAKVDSIGVLGSTGNYAYLTREERARVSKLAIENADKTPVIVGIGAIRTRDVLERAEDAQKAGANGLLLAPVSYQKLTADEVFGLYEAVSKSTSVPVCVYDNPGTTHFDFTDELHGRIAQLPNIASIKIPGVPADPVEAGKRVNRLRALIPESVSIGVSGDPFGAAGLIAGCDAWYSVIGGIFPEVALAIVHAVRDGSEEGALEQSRCLEAVWALFRQFGSLRVMAAAANILDLVGTPNLPLPLKPLPDHARQQLVTAIADLSLKK